MLAEYSYDGLLHARYEQEDGKDILLLYWMYDDFGQDYDLGRIRLEDGTLTVSYNRSGSEMDFVWCESVMVTRLELPAGALTGKAEADADRAEVIIPEPPVEKESPVKNIGLDMNRCNDFDSISLPCWLYVNYLGDDLGKYHIPVLDEKTARIAENDGNSWENAPDWLTKTDYEAAEQLLVSAGECDPDEPMNQFHVSAKYERGEEADVLILYFSFDGSCGGVGIQALDLYDGMLDVTADYCPEGDQGENWIQAFRLELPAGILE